MLLGHDYEDRTFGGAAQAEYFVQEVLVCIRDIKSTGDPYSRANRVLDGAN